MKVIIWRIGLVFAAIITAVVIAAVIGVELNLAALRTRLESSASIALGREVKFDGRLVLVAGTRPSIDAAGIEIANPSGWER